MAAFVAGWRTGILRLPRREPAKRLRLGVGSVGGAISVERGVAVIRRGSEVFFATVSTGVGLGVGVGFAWAVVLLLVAGLLLLILNVGRLGVGEAVATGGFVTGVRFGDGFVAGVLVATAVVLAPVVVPGVEVRPGFSRRAVSSSPS